MDFTDLHALLRVMADRGIDDCVMEVSSHALVLHRVDEDGSRDFIEDARDPLLRRQQDRGVIRHAYRPIIPVELRNCGPQVPFETQGPSQKASVDAQRVR